MLEYDFIVVGGGPAGFFAAITYAELTAGRGRVVILEKSSHLLQKVKISGGGRCNVTHDCPEPKALSKHYPRGERSLIGPFHRWNAKDTIEWFSQRGVELHTEHDGRMFPTSNDSQTIIDCLTKAARSAGVEVITSEGVEQIEPLGEHNFKITTSKSRTLHSSNILLATGGTRLNAGAKLAQALGHELLPAVPSLFTFKISDPRLEDLPGLSVDPTSVSIPGTKLTSTGPLLITHWGVSGPGILKLSAWGARQLAEQDYRFTLCVNWIPSQEPMQAFTELRTLSGKKQISTFSPFPSIPKRLWHRFLTAASIPDKMLWSQLTKPLAQSLSQQLTGTEFKVTGKSLNKDEFVTCGGVALKEINLKKMESKLHPGLYFAGEIMDIDGITGGFNFQNAWTSSHHAGSAAAEWG